MGLLFASAASACNAPKGFWLPVREAPAIILAAAAGDGSWELEAFEPGDRPTGWVRRTPPERIFALFYDEPLLHHRLIAGPIPVDLAHGIRLPRPASVMSLQPDSEAPAWMPSDLPAELLSLRVAPGWTCSTFNATWQALPNTSGETTGLAVRLGVDAALIATESGRFFRVETASVAELDLPSSTPHAAGFADPETAEIWLVGRDGRVVRGRPESGFRAAPSLPPGLGAPWGVDGRRADAPLELFVLTSSHALLHFRDEAWQILQPATALRTRPTYAPIAWSAPGAAVALGRGDKDLSEISEQGVSPTTLVLPLEADTLTSVWNVDGWGVLIGTQRGYVLRRGESAWGAYLKSDAFFDVVAMGQTRGALIFGGEKGAFSEYLDGPGLCPAQALSVHHLHFLVPQDDAVWLVTTQTGSDLEVARVELAPPIERGPVPR